MQSGQIFVAEIDGANVIKFVGDVRLTLCISFDNFIDHMYRKSQCSSVLFDLRDAASIDSTTLGLMAKISILFQDRFHKLPIVVSPDEGINHLLDSMGFDDIFEIVPSIDQEFENIEQLPEEGIDEDSARSKVIEAHKILMSLNEENRNEFHDLINSLEPK